MATALFTIPSLPNHHAHTAPETHPHHEPPPPTEGHHDTHTHNHAHTGEHNGNNAREAAHDDSDSNLGTGVDLGTLTGRRITLKPRRTLSLSPTPARTGDMSMGRNLRAARCLDFTDKDDDDGLYQPSDSESEGAKKKGDTGETNNNLPSLKARLLKRSSIIGGSLTTTSTTALGTRRASVSVKRPLDAVLPCQEIQYLDICYQKVGTLMVQFSPIPRKKIAYHPVLHSSIHYCDVPYCGTGERPIKRKPLQRSHSIAVADLREPVDCEWTSSSYKLSNLLRDVYHMLLVFPGMGCCEMSPPRHVFQEILKMLEQISREPLQSLRLEDMYLEAKEKMERQVVVKEEQQKQHHYYDQPPEVFQTSFYSWTGGGCGIWNWKKKYRIKWIREELVKCIHGRACVVDTYR